MKIQKEWCKIVIICVFTVGMGFAISPKKADLKPCHGIVGYEPFLARDVIPYLGDGRGPGDQIGTTAYDYQANGGPGQRIYVDDMGQAHIDWMWMDIGASTRYCAWNFRLTDGSYFGETPASGSWSGYVQLEVTQDTDPSEQKTVVAYHYDAGAGYYAWIDIDGGQGWGTWPNDPKSPEIADHIWPYVALAGNNTNVVMATADNPVPGASLLHLYLTTDMGNNWSLVADFDSCATISQFVRASRNPGSHKVVFCWTQYIADSASQLDNNVWYMLSTDDGATWGSPINITNYQPYPTDSVRAYTDVNAIFDANDDLHIVWSGRKIDNSGFYVASKIFHWDEVSSSITIVSSPSTYYSEPGGWWIATASSYSPGVWRLPADHPMLVVDQGNNDLYCLWNGNDDYNDGSAGGYFNGEFYGSYSNDNGATWTDYVNLTNTRSPGAGPGQCDDEDYMTACPFVVNDSIFITYVEDKDAGGYPQTEGVITENPVRCWVFQKDLIGIEENKSEAPKITGLDLSPNPATYVSVVNYTLVKSANTSLRLFDAAGRMVRKLYDGYQKAGTHTLDINTGDLVNGTYFLILDTPTNKITQNLIIMH